MRLDPKNLHLATFYDIKVVIRTFVGTITSNITPEGRPESVVASHEGSNDAAVSCDEVFEGSFPGELGSGIDIEEVLAVFLLKTESSGKGEKRCLRLH